MRAIKWAVFVFAVLTLIVGFIIYDTPTEKTPAPTVTESPDFYGEYVYIPGPPPYPEEDTMHYITKEGVLIIYGSGTDDPD